MWESLGLYFFFLKFVFPTPNLMVFYIYQLTFIESLPKLSSSFETRLELEPTLHVPLLYAFP